MIGVIHASTSVALRIRSLSQYELRSVCATKSFSALLPFIKADHRSQILFRRDFGFDQEYSRFANNDVIDVSVRACNVMQCHVILIEFVENLFQPFLSSGTSDCRVSLP